MAMGCRPTTAKVRSALFNIWRGAIVDASWLDVCAGTGAMGAEALAGGAGWVVGIELDPSACQSIKRSWQKVSQSHQKWQVLRGDILKVLPKLMGETFDLIYFDPPYASDLYLPALELLSPLVHSDGAVAVEHRHDRDLPVAIAHLETYDQRRYGDTVLTFYRPDSSRLKCDT